MGNEVDTLDVRRPQVLFEEHYLPYQYDVSADGERFLMVLEGDPHILINLTNDSWFGEMPPAGRNGTNM